MKVYNNNQLYKSPGGDQQNWIFGRIGDQEGAISDPGFHCTSVQNTFTLKVQ